MQAHGEECINLPPRFVLHTVETFCRHGEFPASILPRVVGIGAFEALSRPFRNRNASGGRFAIAVCCSPGLGSYVKAARYRLNLPCLPFDFVLHRTKTGRTHGKVPQRFRPKSAFCGLALL